jgi:hypothetical protein
VETAPKVAPFGEVKASVIVSAPSTAASCRIGTVKVREPICPFAQLSVPDAAV